MLAACNYERGYEIKETISRGGKTQYIVGYKSAIGFNYWHEDIFDTRAEAEYRLRKFQERP